MKTKICVLPLFRMFPECLRQTAKFFFFLSGGRGCALDSFQKRVKLWMRSLPRTKLLLQKCKKGLCHYDHEYNFKQLAMTDFGMIFMDESSGYHIIGMISWCLHCGTYIWHAQCHWHGHMVMFTNYFYSLLVMLPVCYAIAI